MREILIKREMTAVPNHKKLLVINKLLNSLLNLSGFLETDINLLTYLI